MGAEYSGTGPFVAQPSRPWEDSQPGRLCYEGGAAGPLPPGQFRRTRDATPPPRQRTDRGALDRNATIAGISAYGAMAIAYVPTLRPPLAASVPNAAPMLKEMPPAEVALAYPAQILTRFGKWNDVLKTGVPDDGPLSS